MPLASGTQLGPYDILDLVGQGGIGEVYRARDCKMGRDVAVKVLRPEFSSEPERLRLFEQEARATSALNHPNIVTTHDFGEHGSTPYIVMEFVEGETLREMLLGKPLPTKMLLDLAVQMASGLAKAHAIGIVHRDLKPGNLMVSRDGFVKILDFGLAKLAPPRLDFASDLAEKETWSKVLELFGTAQYMSPEQAAGREVDYRSDQFSLGSILYEMATGKTAFQRETVPQTLAAVIEGEPEAISSLSPRLPAPLRWIIERCLAKQPENRYVSTSDLCRELDDLRNHLSEMPSEPVAALSSGMMARMRERAPAIRLTPALAIGLLAIGLATGWLASNFLGSSPRAVPVGLPMALPPGLKAGRALGPTLAISPDGETLAYVLEKGTTAMLYVKAAEDLEPRAMAGTEGARTPFFSPDGRWIGFFDTDDRKLKKVSRVGGEPISITDADYQWGAVWTKDDVIVFSSIYTGLVRVSAGGGPTAPVTTAGVFQHSWPRMLGDDLVLFTVLGERGNFDKSSIAVVPVSGGAPRVVLESGYFPHYASTGHLIFVQGDSVLAAPFDRRALEVTAPAVPVLDDVWTSPWTGYADFALSDTGTLAYVSGGASQAGAMLVAVSREGRARPLAREVRPYGTPRISSDGGQLAVTIGDRQVDAWSYDLARSSFHRLTYSPSWDAFPLWHPRGEWVAFSSMQDGVPGIYRKNLRTEGVEKLAGGTHPAYPGSWSSDGKLLAYWVENPDTGLDIWIHSLETASEEPFLLTVHNESDPEFSPDGRFIAYESNETGKTIEVYARPYPEGHPATKLSNEGGRSPRWREDGKEIYYVVDGRLMAVSVETGPGFAASAPRELFAGPYGRYYDAASDGQQFFMIQEASDNATPARVNYILNWFEKLSRLAPAGR
jgi:Tol biopolymer transport system component